MLRALSVVNVDQGAASVARVLGVGGVFFKSADQAALREWYGRVLGLEFYDWGGVVFTPDAAASHPGAGTVFSPFPMDTDYFDPSAKEFMFNFMVDDLDGMLARCAQHGVVPVKLFPDELNGRFAHIVDPEGRKIELWEPKPMPAA
jgi:predicted enzyme related to lactoylglutathione lyase